MQKQKKSQNELVLDYMKAFGSITSLQAFNDLGVTRLSGRIYDLREQGYHIRAEMKTVPRRNGEMASVKEYSLVKKSKQLDLPI